MNSLRASGMMSVNGGNIQVASQLQSVQYGFIFQDNSLPVVEDNTLTPLNPPKKIDFNTAGIAGESGQLCVTQGGNFS